MYLKLNIKLTIIDDYIREVKNAVVAFSGLFELYWFAFRTSL